MVHATENWHWKSWVTWPSIRSLQERTMVRSESNITFHNCWSSDTHLIVLPWTKKGANGYISKQFVSTELYQWVSTVFERRSFRTLACEQGLIHTAVWAAKPARGLSRVLIPDSWHTFHEFRRCYCIVNESWLLFEWVAPSCMKKSLLSFSHSTIYHKS